MGGGGVFALKEVAVAADRVAGAVACDGAECVVDVRDVLIGVGENDADVFAVLEGVHLRGGVWQEGGGGGGCGWEGGGEGGRWGWWLR